MAYPDPLDPIDLDKDAKRRALGATGTGALSGAAQGAALGASLGGPLAPLGAGIGAGIGALGGAIAGGLGARRSETEKLRDELLQKEINAAEKGKLGLTSSEKGRLIQDETAAAGARVQQQQADIARQELASGGGFSGRYAELQRGLAGQEGEIAARASRAAEDASRATEAQRAGQLNADLAARGASEDAAALMRRQQSTLAVDQMLSVAGTLLEDDGLREALGLVDRRNLTADELAAVAESFTEQYGEGVFGDPAGGPGFNNDPFRDPATTGVLA